MRRLEASEVGFEKTCDGGSRLCVGRANSTRERLSLDEALASLEEGMRPLQPPTEDLARILHKCRKERNLAEALRLHACMRENGLDAHPSHGNQLVSVLVEVGSMSHAQQVFDRVVYRDESSWNSLITGYAKQGELQHALTLYQKLQDCDSLHPSAHTFVALLKACARLKNLERGREIHAEIVRKGLLEANVFLGSTLVDMYAKCGSLAKAQEVFDMLSVRNVVSWTALVAGYVENGHAKEALYCFEQMRHEGVPLDAVTFVCSLKACGNIGATHKGQQIHSEITRKGLERDLVVGSTLVDMYAKCGLLAAAHKVFDKLPIRDVVSWNALIVGYAEHGLGEEALNCFEQMQHDGIYPDIVIFVCVLKACGRVGGTEKGRAVHAEIARKGLEGDLFIGNTLVDLYVKCGLLGEAQEVFNKLPLRTVVSWNAILAGYAEHRLGEEALDCFRQMQLEDVAPDAVTFICSLKACGSARATDKGCEIHAEIARKGLDRDPAIGSTMVDMYAKCGWLAKAQEVFDKLTVRDTVSWNALITGYVEHGRGEEALDCIKKMQHEGISPHVVTFVCSLKACGSLGATDKGQEIHAEIVRKGLERDIVIGSTLVDMYAKCGSLANAQEVFDELPVRDVVLWNALVAGYVDHGCGKDALNYFEQMQQQGVSPDDVSFICSLKACGSIEVTDKGQKIHAELMRKGLEGDVFVGNTLVDMYVNYGLLAEAQKVFDKLPVRSVVSWNALIVGFAEQGCGKEAINCFERMQREGVSMDDVTFVCSLKACSSIGFIDKGQEIHAEITKKGLETDLLLGNTVVDMYCKCGLLAEAEVVFDKLPVRTIVSWNALIAGNGEHGRGEEALDRFEQMQREGVSSDDVTFVFCLRACGSMGTVDKAQVIHAEIAQKGLEIDLFIGNTLIDMYAKCGLLEEAQEVFDKLSVRTVYSWNAIIAGYAQLGEGENVFYNFDKMIGEGTNPNLITFVSILNACNHVGLVDKGQMYFEVMSKYFGIIPTLQHQTCMVDLLGRAGHVDKAVAMIMKMPFHPGIVLWHTVLGACQKWGNVELGRQAFEHAVRLDEKNAAAYVCMSNIYAGADMQLAGIEG